jgi:hypothetical protein
VKPALLSLSAAVLLLLGNQSTYSFTGAAISEGTSAPLLKTQDFKSGEKDIASVSARSLERFLQDLNQRKDWDYACHNGQPGPDAPYLFKWVVRTTTELERRGYYFDSTGQLRRPGVVVPLR